MVGGTKQRILISKDYIETIDLLKDDKNLIEYLANILIDRWVLSKYEIFEEIKVWKDKMV